MLKVVAVDTASDLALLKLGAAPMPYPALPVCNDVALETGDKLVGFGFPLEDADFQHVDLVWQSDDGPGAIW